MPQVAGVAILTARENAAEGTRRFSTDRRRWLQLALAAVWALDGLLQFQTFMFSRGFAQMFIATSGDGNPAWVSASIHWAWSIVAAQPELTNAAFATLQLALGLAIAWRRSLKIGLIASIVWSLLVWWFAEDLGGLLSGGANALSGAPGAVLLYAVLAVLLWPTAKDTSRSFVAAQPIGPLAAKLVWLVLWLGLAALNLQPANLEPNAVRSTVEGMGDGQPGWIKALVDGFGAFSAHDGAVLSIVGATIMALVRSRHPPPETLDPRRGGGRAYRVRVHLGGRAGSRGRLRRPIDGRQLGAAARHHRPRLLAHPTRDDHRQNDWSRQYDRSDLACRDSRRRHDGRRDRGHRPDHHRGAHSHGNRLRGRYPQRGDGCVHGGHAHPGAAHRHAGRIHRSVDRRLDRDHGLVRDQCHS
ncbi:MAG: hypothetical protein WDM88_09450 [Galbitalea sp.]